MDQVYKYFSSISTTWKPWFSHVDRYYRREVIAIFWIFNVFKAGQNGGSVCVCGGVAVLNFIFMKNIFGVFQIKQILERESFSYGKISVLSHLKSSLNLV